MRKKPRSSSLQIASSRLSLATLLFSTLFLALMARLFFIHLSPPSAEILQNIADNQYQNSIQIAPYRGTIYDHRHTPLAISIKAPSLAINPRVFSPSPKELSILAKALAMPIAKIEKLSQKNRYFTWLKRQVSEETAEAIKNLNLAGLHFLTEPARFYPSSQLASTLIGYVGLDDHGLIGLEHKYDSLLKGSGSQTIGLKDARGKGLYLQPAKAVPQKAGNSIFLTLDLAIQEIAFNALLSGVKEAGAKKGFALVADPHTGRILAIANVPSFNPNQTRFSMEDTQNLAASFLFEPGSVMKPFTVALALQDHLFNAEDILNCEKSGRFLVGRNYIHDDHPKELLSVKDVLVHSSNIGTFKIASKLGKKRLYDGFLAFGFQTPSAEITLPGQTGGRIEPYEKWSQIRFANIAFGQGLLVSGLEIIKAYSILANGGFLIAPYLVERIESAKGEVLYNHQNDPYIRVLDKDISAKMRQILAEVVTSGTGSNAQTQTYTTAGKTGTAEKIDPLTKAYSPTKRIANFAGFAPVLDPHLAIYVVIDEPQKKPYYGAKWAAPVFSEIAERTLRYLNVAPDKLDKKKKVIANI
mgnify:CR=1 FL=1